MARLKGSNSYKRVADIFSKMKRPAQKRFMGDLEKHNSDAAEQVRSLMFTFEDLVRIDPPGIQELMRHIDLDQLAVALKGAPEEILELFFGNMSERAGRNLREDISAMGPVRMIEVDSARTAILDVAKSLADDGKIVIGSGEEDEYID